MSIHVLVIAPRPKDGAKLATDGPCQTLAWLSKARAPMLRIVFQVHQAVSLVEADAPRKPVVIQRLTGMPLASWMKFLSRSSLSRRAMRSSVQSQDLRSHLSEPGARYIGYLVRPGECTKSSSEEPLGHR